MYATKNLKKYKAKVVDTDEHSTPLLGDLKMNSLIKFIHFVKHLFIYSAERIL